MRRQTSSGPGVVEWSLPDDEVGEVWLSVDLREEGLDPDEVATTWCPVCEATTRMRPVVTSGGRRVDLCDECGLLLEVDRHLGRVLAHRVSRRPPAALPVGGRHPPPVRPARRHLSAGGGPAGPPAWPRRRRPRSAGASPASSGGSRRSS